MPGVVADLLLVRRQLAIAVLTKLRGQGPTPEIEGAVDAFEASLAHGPDGLAAADVAILQALLAATNSAVLALCLNPVASVLADLPALRAAIYCDPPANLAGWRALLAWLSAPDADLSAITALLEARDRATVASLKASS